MMLHFATSLLVIVCIFCSVPISWAKDVHIQCGDLDATLIAVYNTPAGAQRDVQYSVLFIAKEENVREIVDAMNENLRNGIAFDIFVDGKFAQHFLTVSDVESFTPLVYSPPVLFFIDVGNSLDEARSLASSYCPTTMPEGDALFILLKPRTSGGNQ